WIKSPQELLNFIVVLITALGIDVILNFIRYKQITCAVSAGVTTAILQVLTPGVPLGWRITGITAALVLGKHVWGGTGKNAVNPALAGLAIISFFYKLNFPMFNWSYWILAASVLSLPFILSRPYAAVGLISGMSAFLVFSNNFSVNTLISYGILFFGCLVITDPVTVTHKKTVGLLTGFTAGIVPLLLSNSLFVFSVSILTFNALSRILDDCIPERKPGRGYKKLRIKSLLPYNINTTKFADLTKPDTQNYREESLDNLQICDILQRIKENYVYGCGGAAFSVSQKIGAVIHSNVKTKFFVINAAECDPGLVHDKWLLHKYSVEINKGIQAVLKCVPFTETVLAVKDNSDLNFPAGVRITKLPEYFPVGAEKNVIRCVFNTQLNTTDIPAEKGFLVLNLQTVFAVYEAVYLNKTAGTKFITILNLKTQESYAAKVTLGEKIRNIVNNLYPGTVISFTGGGAMQARLVEDGDVIEKTTNFISIASMPRYKESPLCSRCNSCTQHCPAGLEVRRIAELVDNGKPVLTAKYNPENCISCGICSYICPAGRNLELRIKKVLS
ncbi:MAG: RnfABCDGE type electron transport complex subunit D, partial [Elusimicrobiota bacterium]